MRLIDADALWKDITTNIEYCADILEIIEKQPTIEERKKGKWVLYNPERFFYSCSLCGQLADRKWNYCPNCGAKMGEGEHDG